MHIKKVIIQGFKTYRNNTVIDLISPHHNVVVGRNGSGKLNLFAAIRFVLSDSYTHMTREERQGLIHEGSGTVMSAYVEIIFDNSDRRLPLARDEVSIRRTIGLKKDDYSLENKSVTRSDIMNLLESAGFSKTNPYYIVPQGRITALTNSKDSERLTILKEVSGAMVFEAKLKESVKELNNANYKRQRVDETLQSIDERISDLQVESNDLKEYQALEKSKKVLEYNLFDKEMFELRNEIEDIEEQYSSLVGDSQKDLEELTKREEICRQLSDSINELGISSKLAKMEREQTEQDYNKLLKVSIDKKIKLDELRSLLEGSKRQRKQNKEAVEKHQILINACEKEIQTLKPIFLEKQQKEHELKKSLFELVSKLRALYSKQNRFQKFKSKAQRDKWLKSEIDAITRKLNERQREMESIQNNSNIQKKSLFDVNKRIEECNMLLSSEKEHSMLDSLHSTINELKYKVNELNDQRKSLWRDEIRLRSVQDSLNNDLARADNLVYQTMERSQYKGIQAVNDIVKSLQLESKVYGTLSDLFTVSDKYKVAVEEIAGNSLFHVVVEDDKTAALIMDELTRSKRGRVTFMPLNRINASFSEYPNGIENNCIPLINKLKFEEKFKAAIIQVFGKALVCSDLSRGSELAKSFKLVAVTLDGDRADTKGTLSGGFRDFRNSRIDALKFQSKKRQESLTMGNELSDCVACIENVSKEITTTNNELQFKIRDLEKVRSAKEPLKGELSELTSKKYNAEQELSSLMKTLESLHTTKQNYEVNLLQHQAEIESAFTHSLSEADQQELQQLTSEISNYESKLDSVVNEVAELETQLSKYNSEVNDILKPRLELLINDENVPYRVASTFELKEMEREWEYLNIQLDTAESRNQKASEELTKIEEEISKSDSLLKKANDQQANIVKKLESFSKEVEKIVSKKSLLVSRHDEVEAKIRDLGVLPEEAFHQEAFGRFRVSDLLKKLTTVNDNLARFSHINKKAIEQHNNFARQRDELSSRRLELGNSEESIEILINKLEAQKDKAITKSFLQIAKSFSEIFEKLVPAGTGRLIMQRRHYGNENQEHDEEDLTKIARDNINDYVGVSISASFNYKTDESQRIEQLSGGQKSLCAIALILAIQNSDPAPFYLFDEIDANLDAQYRTAVANLISTLSQNAQFICTTFRPEMLQVANNFYGVMFNNKVSSVSEINREEAMSFVEDQTQR